jgi:hypothetical protein
MSGFDPNDPFNDEEFQFETVELVDTSEINTRVQKAYKKQMQALEKLILPFMKNLMKNPEVETIKWPNRVGPIKAQMDKITAITKTNLDF